MPASSAAGSSLPGYWLVRGNAAVTPYGDAANLTPSPGSAPGSAPVAGVATGDGAGYWTVSADGTVSSAGDAASFGSVAGMRLASPIVGMAATSDSQGYWLVGADGGVLGFGDAKFYGSLGHDHLTSPIVGIVPTIDAQGYWLVGADGGVFAFGDAKFYGSLGHAHLTSPIVSVAASTDGAGYWLVGADGGVFAFGDANFAGSGVRETGSSSRVVGIAPTFDDGGYWLARADGTVTGLGDAPNFGNPAIPVSAPGLAPVVAIVGADRLVPTSYVAWTHQASASCPGLSWTVLAAIAKVESDFGHSSLPGVRSGANSAGAQGPMQFLPATFAAYSQPAPTGGAVPASPYDPVDSIWAAAHMLCANGAGQPATLGKAIFSYNHANWYVNQVEALAASFELQTGSNRSGPDQAALTAAMTQLGLPYVWGGEAPGSGFDCSGLVQWAYERAGILLPRTSQQQWADLSHLPAGAPLQPGDLVFFAGSDGTMTAPGHVGIYVGNGQMLNAPYTGTDIRFDTLDWTDYVGAARPAATGVVFGGTGAP